MMARYQLSLTVNTPIPDRSIDHIVKFLAWRQKPHTTLQTLNFQGRKQEASNRYAPTSKGIQAKTSHVCFAQRRERN